MNLSKDEKRMLDHLRKKDVDWYKMRWLQLAYGFFVIFAYAYFYLKYDEILNMLQDTLGEDSIKLAFNFAVIATFSALTFAYGVYVFIATLVQWNGNWKAKLILKLYDEIDALSKR